MSKDFREVIITGATGGLGSDVIAQLQRLAPPTELGVSVRNPEKASALYKAASGCGAVISANRRHLIWPLPAGGGCF
jgi:uncharacterized protein YbjT (DUF2867 family)